MRSKISLHIIAISCTHYTNSQYFYFVKKRQKFIPKNDSNILKKQTRFWVLIQPKCTL